MAAGSGQEGEFNAFFPEFVGVDQAGLAVNVAGFGLAVVDFAGFLGKFSAHVIAVILDLGTSLGELGIASVRRFGAWPGL